MKYKIIIDKNAEEEIIAVVHAPSFLTQQIENLVCSYQGTDSVMGISRNVHRNKRLQVVNEIIVLNNAKVYYKQAEMWIEAENTEKEIEEMYETMETSIGYLVESAKDIALDMAEIKARIPDITANNSHKIEEYVKALRR